MKMLALALCLSSSTAWAIPVATLDFSNRYYGGVEFESRGSPVLDNVVLSSVTDGSLSVSYSFASSGVTGFGSFDVDAEVEEGDGTLEYRMTSTAIASTAVALDAPDGAFINAYAGYFFAGMHGFGFTVLQPSAYTGDFVVRLGQEVMRGILQPGQYWASIALPWASTELDGGPTTHGQSRHVSAVGSSTFRLVAVPEPATMLLFGAGLLGIGVVRRRRANL